MTDQKALRLFVHVEEPSMEKAMLAWLPRLLVGRAVEVKVIDHGSKSALLAKLPVRMRGYANWPEPSLRVLALVDRDDDDCLSLKRKLELAATSAGLATKASPNGSGRFKVVNRIVIEELEAWFLGDVPALSSAFPGVSPSLADHAKFRDPDAVKGGTWEALFHVLNKAGHYRRVQHLPKIEVARIIAPLMQFDRNRSRSFRAFVTGLEALLTG